MPNCYCGTYCGGKKFTGLFGPPPPLPPKRPPRCKFPVQLILCPDPCRGGPVRCYPTAIECPPEKCVSKCRGARRMVFNPCCKPRPVPKNPCCSMPCRPVQNFSIDPCNPIPGMDKRRSSIGCAPPPPPRSCCEPMPICPTMSPCETEPCEACGMMSVQPMSVVKAPTCPKIDPECCPKPITIHFKCPTSSGPMPCPCPPPEPVEDKCAIK